MPQQQLPSPDPYQKAVLCWIREGSGDAVVNAVAGSGKTTTLQLVGREIAGQSAVFCAFNRTVRDRLEARIAPLEARTSHSLGYALVRDALKAENVAIGDADANRHRYHKLVSEVLKGRWTGILDAVATATMSSAVKSAIRTRVRENVVALTNLCRVTLTEPKRSEVKKIAHHFGVPVSASEVWAITPIIGRVLDLGADRARETGKIDYTDMIWLPHRWKLTGEQWDWVLVDECQDLNRAQLEILLSARAAGGRILFVGDPRQAIYGFMGADAESYDNIRKTLSATEFPLSRCYRCPRSVVELAKQIVPQIEPRTGAPEGTVRWTDEPSMYEELRTGDRVLSRSNAKLVRAFFEIVERSLPARIIGDDNNPLLRLFFNVKRWAEWDDAGFVETLDRYVEAIAGAAAESEPQGLLDLEDQARALRICWRNFGATIDGFQERLKALFDTEGAAVELSSIHKAKGDEFSWVFVLEADRLPLVWKGQLEWQAVQEKNLKYVAITRTEEELILVTTPSETDQGPNDNAIPMPSEATGPAAPASAVPQRKPAIYQAMNGTTFRTGDVCEDPIWGDGVLEAIALDAHRDLILTFRFEKAGVKQIKASGPLPSKKKS